MFTIHTRKYFFNVF